MNRVLVCLAVTLAFVPLSLAAPAAEAPAPAETVSAVAVALPGPVADWQQSMKEQTDAVFAELLAEEGASPELEADKAQVLALIDEAARAAAKLHDARRAYFAAAFSRAGQGSAELMAQADALLAESWKNDTSSLSSFNLWLLSDLNESRELSLPDLLLAIGEGREDEPPALSDYRLALQVELWQGLQQQVVELIAGSYGGEAALTPTQDPCTRIEWQEDEAALRAELGRLFVETETAWAAYARAMQQLICPVPRFHGTAFSSFNSSLMLGLLDSRDKFLAAIARGFLPGEY